MEKTERWTSIAGYSVCVIDGKIVRGLSADKQKTVFPYRADRKGGWDLDQSTSPSAFASAVRRGTMMMF